MSEYPEDISGFPSDILNTAHEITERIAKVHPWRYSAVEDIARAIMAERQRCAKKVEAGLGLTNTSIARQIRSGE